MNTSRRNQKPLLRHDVAIAALLALLTTAVVAYFARLGFQAGFVDMGHDGYQLRQAIDLSRGGVIFRDTFDQYGPLSPYLNLIGYLTLGHRLLAIKWFLAGWYGVTAVLLYALGRQFGGPVLATAGVLVWLGLAPFYQHGVMLSPHAYAIAFQAAAMILVLRLDRSANDRSAIVVGVLCGLCLLLKQSLGALFLIGVVSYLAVSPVWTRASLKRVAARLAFVVAGCGVIVTIAAVLLWSTGALQDWYLQTVQFPKAFYLFSNNGGAARSHAWVDPLQKFVELQGMVEWYWHVLRAIVPVAAIGALVRRRTDSDKLVLVGLVTSCLWFAAFPSANYMHQWWTLSLSFAAAIYVVAIVLRPLPDPIGRTGPVNEALAAVLLFGMVWPALSLRMDAVAERQTTLTTTIDAPWSVSGIRTDEETRSSLASLYRAMQNYRKHHPHAMMLSQDEADGALHGVAATLPLLSFWEDNAHPSPVYWNLPVLSSAVYPEYQAVFWNAVRRERPLIIDFRRWLFPAKPVLGYYLLTAAFSREGRWLLYAPEHEEAGGHGELAVRDPPLKPPLLRALQRPTPRAPQGTLRPSSIASQNPEYISLGSHSASLLARIYIAPEDEAFPIEDVPKWTSTGLGGATVAVPEVQGLSVHGDAPGRYKYLFTVKDRKLRKGDYLFATGTVEEGGVTLGLIEAERWTSFVNVDRPGPFAAVVVAPHDGVYSLTIADYVTVDLWDRLRRESVGRAIIDSILQRLPRAFRIERAGWMFASGAKEPR